MRSSTDGESTEEPTLTFDSFEDLQSRLLLMPRVEEEGLGAIVTAEDSLLGNHVLRRIITSDDQEDHDLLEEEFGHILTLLRQAELPLVCQFSHIRMDPSSPSANDSPEEEEKKEDSTANETNEESLVKTEVVTDGDEATGANEPLPDEVDLVEKPVSHSLRPWSHASLATSSSEETVDGPSKIQLVSPTWKELSQWTSRVKKSSVEFSAVAATTAVQLAMAAKERAASASSTTITQRLGAEAEHDEQSMSLFIHTSSGAWLALPKANASGELVLTNSSVISVRQSATEPCLSRDYSFQWYSSCSNNAEEDWVLLQGATNASFQPSATEVGHRLRCVVTAKTSAEELSETECIGEKSKHEEQVIIETAGRVRASDQLFNGSKQAWLRGTSFGGLTGKDKSSGRNFSVKIRTQTFQSDCGDDIQTSAITIYQVCGKTAEPMHPEDDPIAGVTACIDHSSPKDFQLVFARGIPESASMVAALASDERLTLQASTRLARESLLLALGMANYSGNPKDLNTTTTLYGRASTLDHRGVCEANVTPRDQIVKDTVEETRLSSPPTSPFRLSATGTGISQSSASPSSHSASSRTQERSGSLGSSSILSESEESMRTTDLEREIVLLRDKLERKNKVVAELHRHLAEMEASATAKDDQVRKANKSLQQIESDKQSIQQSFRLVEKKNVSLQETIKTMQIEHNSQVESLKGSSTGLEGRIVELEKTIRTLQNEKAVLSAGVEARESKLSRMEELQRSYSEMSSRVQDEETLRDEIEASKRRCDELSRELDRRKQVFVEKEAKISELEKEKERLLNELELERQRTALHLADIETQQLRIQKLLAERNNYKQKSDSLAKEMARICRNGRSIRDVERILIDETSLRQEVELLRAQKRRALEDLEHFRTAYEKSRSAQQMAGLDTDITSVLERNVELERLLSELTEYVHAKEMQLETLVKINETLQEDLKELTKSSMRKHMSSHDV